MTQCCLLTAVRLHLSTLPSLLCHSASRISALTLPLKERLKTESQKKKKKLVSSSHLSWETCKPMQQVLFC